MKGKLLTAGAWAFALALIVLGADGMTFGSIGITHALDVFLEPIRSGLSFAAQCVAVVVFAAVTTIPAYLVLLPLTATWKSKAARRAISAVVALTLSVWVVFGLDL